MPLSPEAKHEIDLYIAQRDENFAAKQKLQIATEIKAAKVEEASARRANIQIISAFGGISLLAVLAGGYQLIEQQAIAAAQDEAAIILKGLRAEIQRLEDDVARSALTLDSIKAEASSARNLALNTQEKADLSVEKIQHALGQIRAAEGGFIISKEISRINEQLLKIRESKTFVNSAAKSTTESSEQPLGSGALPFPK